MGAAPSRGRAAPPPAEAPPFAATDDGDGDGFTFSPLRWVIVERGRAGRAFGAPAARGLALLRAMGPPPTRPTPRSQSQASRHIDTCARARHGGLRPAHAAPPQGARPGARPSTPHARPLGALHRVPRVLHVGRGRRRELRRPAARRRRAAPAPPPPRAPGGGHRRQRRSGGAGDPAAVGRGDAGRTRVGAARRRRQLGRALGRGRRRVRGLRRRRRR